MPNGTILIIEDDEDAARALSSLLERRGFSPDIAGTLAEGINCAQLKKYIAAIVDLELPDSGPWETARSLYRFGDTPLIACTANGSEKLIEELNSLDIGYQGKPLNMEKLMPDLLWRIQRANSNANLGHDIKQAVDQPSLNSETKVSLGLAQLGVLILTIASSTFYVSNLTSKLEAKVDKTQSALEANLASVTKRLDALDVSVDANTRGDIAREARNEGLLSERLNDWKPWRWSVATDLRNLGTKTNVPIQTTK